jgi:hypothetical protein
MTGAPVAGPRRDETMRVSIVIPSNRTGPAALAILLRASAWASDATEVIIRDNSGHAPKRALLETMTVANVQIIIAPPSDANENFRSAFAAARGDFVLFLGDDDIAFDRGIAALEAVAVRRVSDPGVAGITGAFILEQQNGSAVVTYGGVESEDVVARVGGYLDYQGPNLIFYSAVRRELIADVWDFFDGHPFAFPFHDQFFPLIYLLAGRFAPVPRLTFVYDNGNWDTAEAAARSDLKVYAAAGLDPAIRQLQWFLCAFEGAWIILSTRFGAAHTFEQRQLMANRWFEVMGRRFAMDRGRSYGSDLTPQATALCEKWLASGGKFSLPELLDEICGFLALISPDKAEVYRAFWDSMTPPATDQAPA